MSVRVPEVSVSSSDQVFRAGTAPKVSDRGASKAARAATAAKATEKLPAVTSNTTATSNTAADAPASPTAPASSPPPAPHPGGKGSDKRTTAPPSSGPGPSEGSATADPAAGTDPSDPSTDGAPPPSDPRTATASGATTVEPGPRTVRLTLARVDPLSTLKLSFLLSVALGIAMVAATVVLWQLFNTMGVFSSLDETLRTAAGDGATFDVYNYVGLSRVVSLATFIAVINVIIVMALSTVGAVLYNVASSLVGGLHVTLSDD